MAKDKLPFRRYKDVHMDIGYNGFESKIKTTCKVCSDECPFRVNQGCTLYNRNLNTISDWRGVDVYIERCQLCKDNSPHDANSNSIMLLTEINRKLDLLLSRTINQN